MGDISTWFNGLPPVTKYWFGGTVALSLLGRFGILNPHWLILNYGFIHNFHFWRPLTALLFYPITPNTGFHFLINLYFLYNYSLRLETGLFAGRTADYLFMLIFMWICSVIVALLNGFAILMDPMVIAVLYVWCQLNKDAIVAFWFGTQFKAMYLPWVLFGMGFIMFGSGMMELIGILIGHFYFFFAIKYPQEFGGAALLQTPQFLYSLFPNQRGYVAGFGQAPQYRADQGGNDNDADGGGGGWGGFFRGRGQTMGN